MALTQMLLDLLLVMVMIFFPTARLENCMT